MTGSEMSAPVRAAAYVAGLVVVLVAAWGVGRLVGPVEAEAAPAHSADPSAGRYRLLLEVEHAGAVPTVPCTVSVEVGHGH
jgi:hypothetical protein